MEGGVGAHGIWGEEGLVGVKGVAVGLVGVGHMSRVM